MTVIGPRHHELRELAFVHSNYNHTVVVPVTDKLAAYLAPAVKSKTVEVRMFQSVEVADGGGRRRLGSLVGSLLMQTGLIALAVVLPMLFTDTISLAKNLTVTIVAPPPPAAPPPPKSQAPQTQQKTRVKTDFILRAPTEIPKDSPRFIDELPEVEVAVNNGVPPGVIGGVDNGYKGGVIGGIPVAPPPPPSPAKEQPKEVKVPTPQVVNVSSGVQSAKLVTKVVPVYPQLAKQVRIQGTVKLSATIGKNGIVENLTLVSGQPMLVAAAMDAVRRWVYQPTLLNGEPVSVLTTIDVVFTLTQ